MKLGDTIKVRRDYRYALDWPGQYTVIGMKLDQFGRTDVTISEGKNRRGEWEAPTDGFLETELDVVSEQKDATLA